MLALRLSRLKNRFARRRASGEVLNLSSAGALTQQAAMLRSECWQFSSACKARCANDDAYSCLARLQKRRALLAASVLPLSGARLEGKGADLSKPGYQFKNYT